MVNHTLLFLTLASLLTNKQIYYLLDFISIRCLNDRINIERIFLKRHSLCILDLCLRGCLYQSRAGCRLHLLRGLLVLLVCKLKLIAQLLGLLQQCLVPLHGCLD